MRLQTSTLLALFAVLELTSTGGCQRTVAVIGEKYGVSSHHLAKVMGDLARAGLVRAVRGAGGGYQFIGSTRRLTLLDLIRHFEEPNSVERMASPAAAEIAALNEVLDEIDDTVRATLGSITLATMHKIVERHRSVVETTGVRRQRRGHV